jgi:hypothetical protein
MMRGYEALIAIGYLVPVLDAQGRRVMRNGETVYKKTEDRRILEKVEGLCGNN